MTAKILSAKPVVELTKVDLINRCNALKNSGIIPSMCVVLVGENPASLSYIKNKKKLCEEVGANFNLLQLPETTSEEQFLHHLEKLNKNPLINGMIIQLPVSKSLKKLNLPNLISPEKDIDGFHGLNIQSIYFGTTDLTKLLPCTPKGCIKLMQHYGIGISGKNILVIGRSLIVGKPLAMLLTNFNATVTLAHSQTQNISELVKSSDIVISAIGKPHFLTRESFSPLKNTTVIDVGINSFNGKLVGDVDYNNVLDVVGSISPVPGGVGPMTVLSLIENLIVATEIQSKR